MEKSTWFKSLKKWLIPPVGGGLINHRATTTHVISLSIITAAFVAILAEMVDGNIVKTIVPLSVGIILAAFSLWLNSRGKTSFAGFILVGSLLVVLTWLLINGQGIHDITITLYPVIMIVISLLFEFRTSILGYILVIASVGLVIFGEIGGLYETQLDSLTASPIDFIIVTVILAITGVGLNLINAYLNRSLDDTRQNIQAVKTSEARFRSLAENAPDLILSVDRDGMIQFANRTDRNQQLYPGRNVYQYLQSEQTDQIRALLDNTFKTGEPASLEVLLQNHSGALNWYSCRFGPIWQEGKFDQIVLIVTDIDERKKMEEAFKRRTDQLSTLNRIAATISNLQTQDSLLEEIFKQIQASLPLDAFYVALFDPDRQTISYPMLYENGERLQRDPIQYQKGSLIYEVISSAAPKLLNLSDGEYNASMGMLAGNPDRIPESILMVPLPYSERIIGAVSAQSYSKNIYSQDHLNFLQGAATQIAIAVENARLYDILQSELKEHRQSEKALNLRTDQLTTLNQIARTISSLQELDSLLRLILDQIQQAIPLDCFYVGLYDPELDQVSFPLMFDDGKFWEESQTTVKPDSLIGKCIYQEQEYLLNRTQHELDNFEVRDMLGEKSRISASLLLYPLHINGQCMGLVSAQSYTLNTYSEEHLEFLGGAAAHITVAVQNARLFEDLKRRSEQLVTLNQIAAAVTSQQELDSVFELTFDLLKSNLPLDVFYVSLYDEAEDLISYPILYDGGKRWQEEPGSLSKFSWIKKVITKSEPLLIQRSQVEIDERMKGSGRFLGDRERISASILMVPLQIGSQNIGVVSVQSYDLNAYNNKDLDFLSGAANYVAIAIQNVRLFRELQSELEEGQRSSNALRQSEARLRAIIENIPYELWMVDREQRYVIQSSVSIQVSGALLGKTLDELEIPLEEKKAWERLYRQAREGQSVLEEGEWRVQNELRTFLTMLAPVQDEENMLGFVGMNIDITELKHSEERLRQYAARIEILHEIDQAILAVRSPQEIAVATLSRLPRIVPCSSASLALLNVDELTAEVIAIYSDDEVHPGTGKVPFQDPERLDQLLDGHIVYITDLVTQPLEGPPSLNRVLLQGPIHAVIAVPLRHQDKLVGVLSVGAALRGQLSRDDVQITQEIATQLAISIYQAQLTDAIETINTELEQRVLDRTAQLEEAYRELEAFSYSVSHDLRAPLRGITGYLNFFMEDFGAGLEGDAQDYLQRIKESAKRMNELIDDLLSLSRVGRQKLELTTFSMGELVQQVLSEAITGQDPERIQVTINPLPRVQADRGLLHQVFQNLIDNALKYSSNQPVSQIEIGSLMKDHKTSIYIRDNGVGFDMKFADKLFTPFERLHSRDEYEGTGIGLATVKRILTRHEGQIWVESAPGEGTTFYFTIGN